MLKETMSTVRRIIIVEDHPLVCEGLNALISSQPGLEVVGQADDAPRAIRLVEETQPDIVIVDISLKHGNGIELIKRVKAKHQNVQLIVSSMHDEELYAERALRAGAMGYVHKHEGSRKILDAIDAVLAGRIFVSDRVSNRVLSQMAHGQEAVEQSPVSQLSDRELQVFELIGQGQSTRQIAEKLHLSPKTVERYRENIKQKLNLPNAVALVRHATQWVLECAG